MMVSHPSILIATGSLILPIWLVAGMQRFTPNGSGLPIMEAVAYALANHPALEIQGQEIAIAAGQQLQAGARFDLVFQAALQENRTVTPLSAYDQTQAGAYGIVTNRQAADLTSFGTGFEKVFRNGIIIEPSVNMSRTVDNLYFYNGNNLSTAGMSIILPLMRGRGYAAVGAAERSAGIEVNARTLDGRDLAAQVATGTATSYWSTVAAQRALDIATGSESRGRALVEDVQALIDAGRSPRIEINDAVANLADRSSSKIAAEQRVIAARTELALNMGLPAREMNSLPVLTTDFPVPDLEKLPPADSAALDFYLTEALQRRGAYLAAQRRVEEVKVQMLAARNALKPEIDLTLTVGYAGLREGVDINRWFISPFSGVRGINTVGGVTYSFAHANSAARGQLAQVIGTEREASVRRSDVSRQIGSSLLIAVEGVRHTASRVAASARAVQAFRSALSGQRDKYGLGLGSIVDILTVEDRLTNALLNEVDAQQSYGVALVDFRYATGTLITNRPSGQTIEADVFSTVPFSDQTISASHPSVSPATYAQGLK